MKVVTTTTTKKKKKKKKKKHTLNFHVFFNLNFDTLKYLL